MRAVAYNHSERTRRSLQADLQQQQQQQQEAQDQDNQQESLERLLYESMTALQTQLAMLSENIEASARTAAELQDRTGRFRRRVRTNTLNLHAMAGEIDAIGADIRADEKDVLIETLVQQNRELEIEAEEYRKTLAMVVGDDEEDQDDDGDHDD